jgi:uracil-DNA glycosylase
MCLVGTTSPKEMSFSPHFCRGHFPVAFVFSAPGEKEMRAGKPVAGETGKNLQSALIRLNSAQPGRFPSLDRYDYRITNAISTPMAVALGDSASEALDTEIRADPNVQRVLQEVEGCSLVVLSGNKAKVLARAMQVTGTPVVEVPHVGNKGLNVSFKVLDGLKLASSLARREHRVQLWADAVLRAIAGIDARKRDRSSGK